MDFTHELRVLDWLGSDEKGLGYYLYFLNLRFSKSPEALSRLRQVANQLEREPDYWQYLINVSGWRTQIIGCYSLLITQNKDHLEALKIGLRRNTWSSPQVAVTLGILYPFDALLYLEQWLNPSSDANPKAIAGAYQVLLHLGASSAKNFDIETYRDRSHPTSGYTSESHWRSDFDIGRRVSQSHWQAWQEIIAQGIT